MDIQERAVISKQFIESLLEVPVFLCPAAAGDIRETIASVFPNFLKDPASQFISDNLIDSLEPLVLYHITDFLSLNFNLFLLGAGQELFIAGPYLLQQADSDFCEHVLQENNLNLSLLVPFSQYCLTLPVISNSRMLNAARTALKLITGHDGDVPYRHYQSQHMHSLELNSRLSPESMDSGAMELLEQRYYYEKMLLQAVSEGNANAAQRFYKQFIASSSTIIRTEDPLRTIKNLSYSLNTMLRKSAETAGIHPVHLDIISSNIAIMIEQFSSMEKLKEFRYQMINSYCRFVQTYRMDGYPALIRKTITYIQIHLADSLSLKQIAAAINISPSYLSQIFNAEMNESLPNYIMRVRIDKAAELLSFSDMSVQQISAYVGFSDLNYFSRCFKKLKQKTPTAYRAASAIGA